jgi:hypothetical protein
MSQVLRPTPVVFFVQTVRRTDWTASIVPPGAKVSSSQFDIDEM